MSINDISGDGGAGYATGAVTITAPAKKKIYALGVIETANVTNLKYTPPNVANRVTAEKTVVLDWMGKSLPVVGATAFLPLGYDANSVDLASGTVIPYFRSGRL